MNQTNKMTTMVFEEKNWQKVKALSSTIVISMVALIGLFYLFGGSPKPLLAAIPEESEGKVNSAPIEVVEDEVSTSPTENNLDALDDWSLAPVKRASLQVGGDLTVTGDVHVDYIRYPMTSTVVSGSVTIPVTTTDFEVGHEVLIMTMLSDDVEKVGQHETAYVSSVNTGSLTLSSALTNSYDGENDKVVVQLVPHFDNIVVQNGGKLTAHAWNGITGGVAYLRATAMTIEPGGQINLDHIGFRSQEGPGTVVTTTTTKGAGHGGYGDGYGVYGMPYGSAVHPSTMGSGGGGTPDPSSINGRGGGLIFLSVSGSITNNGTISANGQAGSVAYCEDASSGSAGSIWLEANVVTGLGLIQTNGGGGGSGCDGMNYVNAGAGGRIAISANTSMAIPENNIQSFSDGASPGTVFIAIADQNLLNIDNNGQGSTYIRANSPQAAVILDENILIDKLLLNNTGHLEISRNITFVNEITITNDSILFFPPLDNGDSDYSDDITNILYADTIYVDDTSKINADGFGYQTNMGPGAPSGSDPVTGRAGAGHGGIGGGDGVTDGGNEYGDELEPTFQGSGGSGSGGGAGGGAIHLVINDKLWLDGSISANGNDAIYSHGGGGSGGSIWIESQIITGTGYMNAGGGTGYGSSSGGGGGGRIAIYAAVNSLLSDSFGVYGGAGSSVGLDGTIHIGNLDTISNLQASNNSPTELGQATTLTATIDLGDYVSYIWLFGDGNSESGQIVTHTYQAVGIYTATVTASNVSSSESVSTVVTITDVPVISLSAINDGPTDLGQETTLTASASPTATNVVYTWHLGDAVGTMSNGAVITHEYTSPGSYTAIVTASNSVSQLTATTTVDVLSQPDLALQITGPTSAPAGSTIVYDIVVANQGNAQASNVFVTDTLPASLSFVDSSRDYTYNPDSHTVVWHIPVLGEGITETFTLQADIAPEAEGTALTNWITGTLAEYDGNLANNQASFTTTVTAPIPGPDLRSYKNGSTQVPTGFPADYTITIVNQGGQRAPSVTVTDTLPLFMTLIDSSIGNDAPWNETYDPATRTIVWQLGDIAPGASYEITMTAQVTENALMGYVVNQVTASMVGDEADVSNNDAVAGTTIIAAAPHLTVSPSNNGGNPIEWAVPIANSQAMTLPIQLTNSGTADISGTLTILRGIDTTDVNYDWLHISPLSIPGLAIGESVTLTLAVTGTDVPDVGEYRDWFTINTPGDNRIANASVYLMVYAHPDLITFAMPVTNTLGEAVSGAQIQFTKTNTRSLLVDGTAPPWNANLNPYFTLDATTNITGEATITDLEVGIYDYEISAPGHRTLTGTFNTASDISNDQFLTDPLLALPGLVFEPSDEATLSVTAGESTYFTFRIRNEGPAPADNFTIETPSHLDWLSSGLPTPYATDSTAQLLKGEAMSITLFLSPSEDEANTYYTPTITVSAQNVDDAYLYALINVLTATTGSLNFTVTDNLGVPIPDAEIIVTNQSGRTVNGPSGSVVVYDTQTVATDENGAVTVNDLPPAEYTYMVNASGYHLENGTTSVGVGSASSGQNSNQVSVNLNPDPFTYNWTVEETTIPDTYAITVEVTYEAEVGQPLLYINYAFFCPGEDVDFFVANMGPVRMDNLYVWLDHDGVTSWPRTAVELPHLEPGEVFTGTLGTSGGADVSGSGRLRVSSTYDTQSATFPYETSNKSVVTCPAGSGGGWQWERTPNGVRGGTGGGGGRVPHDVAPGVQNGHEVAKLILSGDATLERQAFNARLELNTLVQTAIEDITVNLEIKDDEGTVVNSFAITPTLPTVLGNLTPTNPQLVGQWLIVPGDLGITDTNGSLYHVQASITYTYDGSTHVLETLPRAIRVLPQPYVRLNFSHTQPDEYGDFYVEISARNDGYGVARNLLLDLSTVTTMGDLDGNGRSLIFELKEATLNGVEAPLEYIFRYGDLQPGQSIVGRWKIGVQASDDALLINQVVTGFKVTCKHEPYQGLDLSPLLDCGETSQIFLSNYCGPFLCSEDKNAVIGSGVNTANGNQSYQQSGPSIATLGNSIGLDWSYNSANSGASGHPALPAFSGPMGNGWTHNYDIHLDTSDGGVESGGGMAPLTVNPSPLPVNEGSLGIGNDGLNMTLRGPDGSPVIFQRTRDQFEPSPGVLADMVAGVSGTGDSVYTVTAHTQAQYIFNSDGKLTQQIDPQGNRINLEYNVDGQLERVIDPISGRDLDFAYDTEGRLETVTDPLNRTTVFGYDTQGLLTSVTDTSQQVWTYEYDQLAGGEQVLSRVSDPEQRVLFDNDYDDLGRVITQTYQGHTFSIDYYEDGRRDITDGLDRTATHVYNSQNLLVATRDALGGQERFALDGYTNRIFSQDKLGNPTYGNRSQFGYSSDITNALDQTTYYDFDPLTNNLLKTTDARNHATIYDYDGNLLITETNHLSHTVSHSYNQYGQRTSTTTEAGSTTRYGYDSLGQMTVITDNLGLTTRYEHDGVGRVITTTNSQGLVTINAYDDADRITQVTRNYLAGQPQNYQDKYNLITSYGYDKAGNQIAITDTVGQVNLNLYDTFGRVVTHVTNYDGVTPHGSLCTDFTNPDPEYNICSLTEYNEIGQVVATVSSLGRRYVKEYDELGRVVRTVSNWQDGVFDVNVPDEDIETRTQYDAVGNTIIVTDTLGRMTRHFYDELNRSAGSIANWSGGINSLAELPTCLTLSEIRDTDICTLYEYDEVGNTIIVTDTMGRMTRTFYDELNRVKATVSNWNPDTLTSPAECNMSPDNVAEENICSKPGYDNYGRHITSTNALGQTSLTVYDNQNRPYLSVANWDGTPIPDDSYCSFPPAQSDVNLCTVTLYDALGRSYGTRNPMGYLSTVGYDDIGRVVTTTRYLDGVAVNSITEYDVVGNQVARTDAEGNPTTTQYDSLNRVLSTTSAEGVVMTRTYNAAGQVLTTTNSLGYQTSSRYDGLGRTWLTVDGEGNTTESIFDGAGNRVGVIDGNDVRTTMLFDDLDRRVGIIQNDTGGAQTDDSNVLTQYIYDALGNPLRVINAKGISSTVTTYDSLNRPILVTDALFNTTTTAYNALGHKIVMTDGNDAITRYLYDGLNRLQTVVYEEDGTTVSHEYDALGNRLVMTDSLGTTTYAYDELSRMTTITDSFDAVVAYDYDLNNNRTHLTYPSVDGQPGKVVTYTYNDDNQLDTVTDWDSGLTDYAYDAAGRLITMTLPNGVKTVGEYDRAGRLTTVTHTSPGDELLGQYDYLLDGLGQAERVTETLSTSALISVTAQFLEQSGLLVIEAEEGESEPGNGQEWQTTTNQTGYVGDGYVQALPDVGAVWEADDTDAVAAMQFPVQIETSGSYAAWVRGYASDAGGDALHLDVDGATPDSSARVTGFEPNSWDWSRLTMSSTHASLSFAAAGDYNLQLLMREDGMRVDRLLLVTDTNYIPSGSGPAASEIALITDTVAGQLTTHVVAYQRDGLNRLTEAEYSGDITANYSYAYDVVGNRTSYTASLTSTVVTTYTYNAANQLETAKASDSPDTWYYVYDGNGSRVRQVPGGLTPAEGETRYTFNQARQMVRVESHDGISYTVQAAVAYNGLQQRVQTIAYAASSAITVTYTLDGQAGLPLIIDDGQTQTLLLYGQNAIGEWTGDWQYYLGDKELSVRQLTDASGAIFLTRTYAPFGLLLQETGNGNAMFGYATGQASQEGLWFFGEGYYDPNTGQFLSINRDGVNRFAASSLANPAGLVMLPMLILYWRRKKKGKKLPSTGLFVFVLLFSVGLVSCGGEQDPGMITTPSPTIPVIENTPTAPGSQQSGATSGSTGGTATMSPTPCGDDCPLPPPATFTPFPTVTSTSTPTLTPTPECTLPILINNVPLYNQLENPTINPYSSCGPTAISMNLNYLRLLADQELKEVMEVVNFAIDHEYYLPDDPEDIYTSPANLVKIAQQYGQVEYGNVTYSYNAESIDGNLTNQEEGKKLLKDALCMGKLVIVDVTVDMALFGDDAAHYVVVTGIDENWNIIVNDPYTMETGASVRTITWENFWWSWGSNSDREESPTSGSGFWMIINESKN